MNPQAYLMVVGFHPQKSYILVAAFASRLVAEKSLGPPRYQEKSDSPDLLLGNLRSPELQLR